MSSDRTLQRIRTLAGAQGDRRPLFAELEALEEIADVLPEPVVDDAGALDGVDERAAERGGLVAEAQRVGRIVVRLRVAEEKLRYRLGRCDRLVRLPATLLGHAIEELHDPIRQPSRVRDVQRNVEER